MAIVPKTFDQIMGESIASLSKALEVEMFYGHPRPEEKLCGLLSKLGIKSARSFSMFKFEGLDTILKSVTFDSTQLKLWKDIK
jgi:hypothetical protein